MTRPRPPRRRWRASLTTRLTLLFTAVASVALALLGGITLLALSLHFEAQDRALLHNHLQQARHLLARVDNTGALSMLAGDLDKAFSRYPDLAVRVQGAYGQPLFEQLPDAQMPTALLARPSASPPAPLVTWRTEHGVWRGSAMVMPLPMPGAAPLTVAMAMDIHHHDAFITRFRHALIGYVVLAALGCALLGGWAVRRGLHPLAAMRAQAGRIGAGQLDARMPVDDGPEELAELAAALNAMLARLQDAFARLSTYSSDIAHELRTPLSNLMTQTQVALSQPRDGAAYREVLASNAEELERLSRTVADMLFLAQAEHGGLLPSREPVALADEVRALFDFYDALADERGVHLRLQGEATVMGDRLMLRRAVGNLLSNALRYTPAGGAIDVRLDPRGAEVALTVRNDGPPIAPEQLPHLFERFYRAEKDRSHASGQGDGAGLGLAITQALVQAHGGRIMARAEAGGNAFELVLPTAALAGPFAPPSGAASAHPAGVTARFD